MLIDNMLWYTRIGVCYSVSHNSLCNYTHNFKMSFLNKNDAVTLIVFCQYFLLWISCLGTSWYIKCGDSNKNIFHQEYKTY